ncbi:hypothetical protein [Neorhizobium sp. DT-125]|uniref:hypothetical protein n=1 Tax=Neorhizobium sp. DT-125 TaxID=3396163 RepID=UPI003F1A7761
MAEEMDFERQMLNRMSALIDVIQPLTNQVGRLTDGVGRYDAEFEKLHKQNNLLRQDMIELRSGQTQLKSELTQLKSDVTSRLDAITIRLEEIENTGEKNAAAIRALAADAVLQHNAILNALQESNKNDISLRELEERIVNLERRMGI